MILKIIHIGMETKVLMKLAVLVLQLDHAKGIFVRLCKSVEMKF